MAERRMFAKTVIDGDAFLILPLSAQALYFHFAMRADDDGFVNNPKRIQKLVDASDNDFQLLLDNSFILAFESGIIVIRHWKLHNYIQKDRYKETLYLEEKSQLSIDKNGVYTVCIQNVYSLDTQVSIGKDSIEIVKDSIGKDSLEIESGQAAPSTDKHKRFVKPTLEEIAAYCQERNNGIDAQRFFDFYESKGWKIGSTTMKDWKAAVRTWEKRDGRGNASNGASSCVINSNEYDRED